MNKRAIQLTLLLLGVTAPLRVEHHVYLSLDRTRIIADVVDLAETKHGRG